MQFAILARDGLDAGALDRRMAAREQHLANSQRLVAAGQAICRAAMLDDDDRMVGSIMILDFPSRADLDAYLADEPYVTGDVWQDIQVVPCRVVPN